MNNNLCELLKSATQSVHKEVEKKPLFCQLMTPELTIDRYAQTLNLLYSWTSLLEQYYLYQWQGLLQKPFILQTKLLHQDLLALNQVPNHTLYKGHIDTSTAASIGALYVIEGARLGGQILAPRIQRTLGRRDVTAFYEGLGAQTKSHWGHVQSKINEAQKHLNTRQTQQAINAAQACFALLIRLSEHPLHPDKHQRIYS